MITLITFFTLCLIEFCVIYIYYNKIKEINNIGESGTRIVGIDVEYNKLVVKFIKWITTFKTLIWIPIIQLLFINLIISLVFSILITFLLLINSLFL